jgi:hypothetical protein
VARRRTEVIIQSAAGRGSAPFAASSASIRSRITPSRLASMSPATRVMSSAASPMTETGTLISGSSCPAGMVNDMVDPPSDGDLR